MNDDKAFFLVLFLIAVMICGTMIGINYNKCKVYEAMSKAGYEQKIDNSFGNSRTIWVKVKNDSENLTNMP